MDAYFNMLQLILSDGCELQCPTADITRNSTFSEKEGDHLENRDLIFIF